MVRLVDSYTAILTMIAVALFLFGSAYVLYGRNRVIFTVLGAYWSPRAWRGEPA